MAPLGKSADSNRPPVSRILRQSFGKSSSASPDTTQSTQSNSLSVVQPISASQFAPPSIVKMEGSSSLTRRSRPSEAQCCSKVELHPTIRGRDATISCAIRSTNTAAKRRRFSSASASRGWRKASGAICVVCLTPDSIKSAARAAARPGNAAEEKIHSPSNRSR